MDYLDAIAMAPPSLQGLIIDEDTVVESEMLDEVFDLLGPQILTLSVHYYEESPIQLTQIFTKFPNLLHLSMKPWSLLDQEQNPFELKFDHPLRSLTLNLYPLEDIFEPDLLDNLLDLLHNPRLPNIKKSLLSGKWSGPEGESWVDYLRRRPLLDTHIELFEIGKFLQQRSDPSSGFRKNGVWLVDGERDPQENNDIDDIICEFTVGNITRIKSVGLRRDRVGSEEIMGDGGESLPYEVISFWS
jgi:hypothetical protein